MAVRIVALALALAGACASPARATHIHVVLAVKPGPLRLTADRPAAAVAPGFAVVRRVRATVVDARGNGGGWTIDLSLRRPSAGARIVSIVIARGRLSTCSLPEDLAHAPAVLTGARPTQIVTARPGTGMGRIDLTVTIGADQAGIDPVLRIRPL
ncbi:MAG TPA: hypothetical protein VLJ76_10345 [Gaiellaceae bacterium]|nr:hypothetical protein [Gaiellaceae bacterium]